jgi:hypothetical protein
MVRFGDKGFEIELGKRNFLGCMLANIPREIDLLFLLTDSLLTLAGVAKIGYNSHAVLRNPQFKRY